MPYPIATLDGSVETAAVKVVPAVDQPAGTGFSSDAGFVIPSRDLVAGEIGEALASGRFRCRKQNESDTFSPGQRLSFSSNGVIAGADPLKVAEASTSVDEFVFAELDNDASEGTASVGVGTLAQMDAVAGGAAGDIWTIENDVMNQARFVHNGTSYVYDGQTGTPVYNVDSLNDHWEVQSLASRDIISARLSTGDTFVMLCQDKNRPGFESRTTVYPGNTHDVNRQTAYTPADRLESQLLGSGMLTYLGNTITNFGDANAATSLLEMKLIVDVYVYAFSVTRDRRYLEKFKSLVEGAEVAATVVIEVDQGSDYADQSRPKTANGASGTYASWPAGWYLNQIAATSAVLQSFATLKHEDNVDGTLNSGDRKWIADHVPFWSRNLEKYATTDNKQDAVLANERAVTKDTGGNAYWDNKPMLMLLGAMCLDWLHDDIASLGAKPAMINTSTPFHNYPKKLAFEVLLKDLVGSFASQPTGLQYGQTKNNPVKYLDSGGTEYMLLDYDNANAPSNTDVGLPHYTNGRGWDWSHFATVPDVLQTARRLRYLSTDADYATKLNRALAAAKGNVQIVFTDDGSVGNVAHYANGDDEQSIDQDEYYGYLFKTWYLFCVGDRTLADRLELYLQNVDDHISSGTPDNKSINRHESTLGVTTLVVAIELCKSRSSSDVIGAPL